MENFRIEKNINKTTNYDTFIAFIPYIYILSLIVVAWNVGR